MAALCREFDISRQTGHMFYKRYKDLDLEALTDRSRRPYRQANVLPERVELLIVQLRREHPSWGAPKIREKALQRLLLEVRYFRCGSGPLAKADSPDYVEIRRQENKKRVPV